MSINTADIFNKTDIVRTLKLRLVSELPYPCFNGIQSQVMNDILYTDIMKSKLILSCNLLEDESIVVASPTGSGKTVLFEFGIIHLMEQMQSSQDKHDFKILYMAPLKALCTERLLDWGNRFGPLGLKCIELTGDSDISELNSAYNYQLILTTPEKWDSLTRKWRDHENFIKSVKLFLIDEAHILNEEKRGATLEAVVSRMKLLNKCRSQSKNENYIRFIALSATITNIEDIAVWLGRTHNSPALFKKMGNEMRPVTLHKVVKGYSFKGKQSQYQFDINLSYKIKEILFEYSEGKPSLIFCSTRNGVQQTCTVLSKELSFSFTEEQQQKLTEASAKLTDSKLSELVTSGIGYHHAGMLLNDKHHIMKLFQDGYLPILVATSTLAMGVNLPAHLVIVKSTQHYVDGSFKEYSEVQLLQMIGRAGRPQYDTSATAVIMTVDTNKVYSLLIMAKYERLISGVELIESSLHRHLAEYLNAEIVLGTITDIPVAMDWIRSTFLYIRASVNPKHYGISPGLSKEAFEGKLQDMCMRELNSLVHSNLVIIKNDYDIQTNENGILMAHYCISLETMKTFMQLKGTESVEDMICLLSRACEFSDIKLRVNEKSVLNYLNKNNSGDSIRFPLKGRITTKFMKINCLIQSVLSCLPINDPSLNQEATRIIRLSQRLMKAFSSYIWRQPYYMSLVSSTILTKCLECKLWENSPYVVRQLPGIGSALASLLVAAGKTSFKAVADANPRDLERILNRHPPFGNHLQERVWRIPQYNLEMVLIPPSAVSVTVLLMNPDEVSLDDECSNQRICLLIGDSNNRILHKEKILNSGLLMRNSVYTLTVPLNASTDCTHIETNLISNTWVGIDKRVVLQLLQQSKTSVQIQKEDRSGIKINSQQPNRHYSNSEKTKTKSCTPDLKSFNFAPRKRIRHCILNSTELTCDSSTRKVMEDLNNSNSSNEFQHHVNDSKNNETNFADIDDLLNHNLSNETLLLIANKLATSQGNHCAQGQSKKSKSFLFENTSSTFKKDSVTLKNALPVSVNKLAEKQDKILANNENKNSMSPSKLSCKQNLQTDTTVNLKNIFPLSTNKLFKDQHKTCARNNKDLTYPSNLSYEQDLQTKSFFSKKSMLPVSDNELSENQKIMWLRNENKNPVHLSEPSHEGDLKTEATFSKENSLQASVNNLFAGQLKICTINKNKNVLQPAKLLLKEDFETKTIHSQKHEYPVPINSTLKFSQNICATNRHINLTSPSKFKFEGHLKTEAVISQKNSQLVYPNQPLKSPHKVCAESENNNSTSPSKSLSKVELETKISSEMKQSGITFNPTTCIDLIPEKTYRCSQSNNSQTQIQKQTRNLYYPMFLSLNEIHGENEYKEVNVTLTTDVNNCDKQIQRKYNSGELMDAKNDQKDSLNCMHLPVSDNSKVLDKKYDHCEPCKSDTEKQQTMTSCYNLNKDELTTGCFNEIPILKSNDSVNTLNYEEESEKECSIYPGFFEDNNIHNDMDDETVEEEFSNDLDGKKGNISYSLLNPNKKVNRSCLSGIYNGFSDMEGDNLGLHKKCRNIGNVKQIENINRQDNKLSTLFHQSFINIRQEKYLSQSGLHSSMFVSSTMRTRLNRKYELCMQRSLLQADNTIESQHKNYETSITGKTKINWKNRYNRKDIILPSELKANSLNNAYADKSFGFHTVFTPGLSTQKRPEDTSDLAETEENCFPSSVPNYEAERSTLNIIGKYQPSLEIQRHSECKLKDRPCHDNVSFSQKEAFMELYGSMNYQDCKRPVSKSTYDSNSNPLLSSNTQLPNSVYLSSEETEVKKSDHLVSDQDDRLLDFNLSQFNVEGSENCGENVHNNNVSNKETSSITTDNKQYFNWFCGNNFGINKDFNLSENQVETNDKSNSENVYITTFSKFCKKSLPFNIYSHNLNKREEDNAEFSVAVKKIKF